MPKGAVYDAINNVGNGSDYNARQSAAQERIFQKRLREELNKLDNNSAIAREKKIQELREKFEEERLKDARKQQLLLDADIRKENKKDRKKEREEEKKANLEYIRQLKELGETLSSKQEKLLRQQERKDARQERKESRTEFWTSKVGKALEEGMKVIGNAIKAFSSGAEKYMNTYSDYMAGVEARIQGAYNDMTYESLSDLVMRNTTGSSVVTYGDVMKNLSELVGQGVAENVAQRAFLATVSDKIATTFDAFDSNLLRIIRLQQQDTTASRLGMEAELTQLFNYYFGDTSYLSQGFDNVTAALTDLSSQLSATFSVEFEYIVQKWLGSLGSVGVDSSTLTNIATAINALGTGQIDTLTSNSAMQNLLVMAANRTGLSYSDMLVNGLSATDVNNLLYGIIDYIQDVTSGANNVVRAQYAQLFGLTVADISAFQNISDSVINELYNSAMTYNDTLAELNTQLDLVSDRTPISKKIDNVIENLFADTGTTIASNSALYGIYHGLDVLEGITGGIHIPTISVFGSSVTLPDSIESMVKNAIIGIDMLGSIVSAVGSFSKGDYLSLSSWETDWNKGSYSGFSSINALTTSSSSASIVSNTNSTGLQQSVYDEQKQSAQSITGEDSEESNSELLVILRALLDYFNNGGKSDVPLKVQMVTPVSQVQGSNGQKQLTINDLLTIIKDRLIEMGTDEHPMYIIDDTFYGEAVNLPSGIGAESI